MRSQNSLKTLDEIRSILNAHRAVLRERYGVKSIAVFGSYARGEATETSDIDLIVEFSEKPGLLKFVNLEAYLSKILGIPVELTTTDALRAEIRETALKESVRIGI
ncbi:MAG: nucleotidyltransferase family protein [Fimbriimonadales bacterium]|nr:nucleotidyltransferase family protein [Fimbriimonadales bacterium]